MLLTCTHSMLIRSNVLKMSWILLSKVPWLGKLGLAGQSGTVMVKQEQ